MSKLGAQVGKNSYLKTEWSPDERRLAVCAKDARVFVMATTEDVPIRELPRRQFDEFFPGNFHRRTRCSSMKWRPDGRQLAIVDDNLGIELWDPVRARGDRMLTPDDRRSLGDLRVEPRR